MVAPLDSEEPTPWWLFLTLGPIGMSTRTVVFIGELDAGWI